MTEKIDSFVGEYHFLSNFYYSPITYESIYYPTVEHAFQAAKTLNEHERVRIASLHTPGAAKSAGRRVELREDWERSKIWIMTELIGLKFPTHSKLATQLLFTHPAELIEGNTWNDKFWGLDLVTNQGENHLGKILMNRRIEIANELADIFENYEPNPVQDPQNEVE